MRHKYSTSAIVLARTSLGEANALVILLTSDLGLVHARAQSVRRSGAKLAPALQTLSECRVALVRGKETWRLSGALEATNHFKALPRAARERAARVAGLLLRLVRGEHAEPELFHTYAEFMGVLPALSEVEQDAAECLVALRILRVLGCDDGPPPAFPADFASPSLAEVARTRSSVIARINRGIAASGL